MLLSLIQSRRSIRKFKNLPVEKEKVDILVEAMLRSPSSKGLRPWEFIVLDDREILGKLSHGKPHGSSFLQDAPLAIVVCADSKVSDVWVEDASIAATYIQLTAHSLGLGSCWIQIRKRPHSKSKMAQEFVGEQLDIPAGICVESIIAIGYADERKSSHGRETLQWEKVRLNRYETCYRA